MDSSIESSNAAQICLPFLRESQNSDGGWGYRPGTPSRVEAACWALFALWEPSQRSVGDRAVGDRARVERARDFLQKTQLTNGSWPAAPGEETGCWVTSLCCLSLTTTGDGTQNSTIDSGLRWICNDWPSDSTLWRRFLARFSSERDVAPINYSYRGWGWTPETSSWVEPTSFALLALEGVTSGELTVLAGRRRSLATSLLFDRMCPGGGWNAGNPVVYGAAGEPSVVPTVWALLALRNLPPRDEVTVSLNWLERAASESQSPASAALARICLRTYGRVIPAGAPGLNELLRNNEFLSSVPVAAWVVLASASDFWLMNPATGVAAA
jgi:hypothetical protein